MDAFLPTDFDSILLAESPTGRVLSRTDGAIAYWSAGAEALFGYSHTEAVGKTLSELIVPEDMREEDRANKAEVVHRGSYTYESCRCRKDGTLLHVLISNKLIHSDNGEIEFILSEKTDISHLKVLRDAKLVDAKYGALLESTPDAILIVNPTGRLVLANSLAEQLFGYSRGELLGLVVEQLLPERYHRGHVGHRSAFFQEPRTRSMGAGLELYGIRKDGSEFPIEIGLSPLVTEEGTLVMCAVRDIGDRKQAELKFRCLIESAPDAMVIVNSDGVIVVVNSQTERLFGYPREELIGQKVEILVPSRHRASHIGHRSRFSSEPQPRSMGAGLELYGLRKDGMEFPVEISLSPLHTEDGVLFASAIRDITDRKLIEREIRSTQVELARMNRELEAARDAALLASRAKSDFLASMSHEIRTPLNGVLATASLMLERNLDFDVRSYAEMISRSGKTLMRVIDDILDMSKIEAGKMAIEAGSESVITIIEDVVQLHRNFADGRGLKLSSKFAQPIPKQVLIDGARFRQVLGNLVGNAIKFTNAGGVEIDVEATQLSEKRWRLTIAVADSGIGIPEHYLPGIFEAFAQGDGETYRRFGGAGLGLAISRRIIELMGGELTVASTVGKGSVFTIRFSCDSTDGGAPVPAVLSSRNRQGIAVLLAEDNEINAIVATDTLALLGCQVTHVWDGKAAVQEAALSDFEFILLDIHMPVYSGIEACRMVRANGKNAHTLIAALTASVTADEVEKCLQAGMDFVIGKPFTFSQMRETLAKHFPAPE